MTGIYTVENHMAIKNAIENLYSLMWQAVHEPVLSENTRYSVELVKKGSLLLKDTQKVVRAVALGEGNRVARGPERKIYSLVFGDPLMHRLIATPGS